MHLLLCACENKKRMYMLLCACGHKFSKALSERALEGFVGTNSQKPSLVALYIKYTRALTWENFCPVHMLNFFLL